MSLDNSNPNNSNMDPTGNSTTSPVFINGKISPKQKSKPLFHHNHSHYNHHQIQPKTRSKSFAHCSTSSPSPSLPGATAISTEDDHMISQQQQQKQQQQRRASSFSSYSSPWFRRKSFLSSSMMSNDKSSVYELSSYSYDQRVPSFTLSLKESQGFIFNQDLFASQYQQSRVLLQDDVQGTILKDLRNERSLYNTNDNEDYGIETTEVFIESGESDNEDAIVL